MKLGTASLDGAVNRRRLRVMNTYRIAELDYLGREMGAVFIDEENANGAYLKYADDMRSQGFMPHPVGAVAFQNCDAHPDRLLTQDDAPSRRGVLLEL